MKIYNSLTKKLETFKPIANKEVKMYVCGITPYDTTHLGHAFTYVFFDSLVRFLKYKKYKVTYTQNVTDINDRDNDILQKAKEQNESWQNLSKFWTDKFLKDMGALNWVKPTNFLYASKQIPQIVKLIDALKNKGFTYEKNRELYLDIKKVKYYGKLSQFNEDKMMSLAREFEEDLENPDKIYPLDITLWRPTIEGQPTHIPSFNSPFGPGRPGWHIECSAMAIYSLGEQIDIHGGGVDLIYPHHESEIAQSESATGKIPFAKYWIHTELVSYQGQKMSKSLGNLVLVSDLLKKYSANAIRYVLLSHHYRKPWEFHIEELDKAEDKINKLKQAIKYYPSREHAQSRSIDSHKDRTINSNLIGEFVTAIDEDFDTPKALKVLIKSVESGLGSEANEIASILGLAISNY